MITPQQRTLAKAILDHATENNPDLDGHTESLIRVLGSVIEGVPVMRAMGAPGDWGYGTPIGDAVLEILRENTQTMASEGLPSVPGSADRISDWTLLHERPNPIEL